MRVLKWSGSTARLKTETTRIAKPAAHPNDEPDTEATVADRTGLASTSRQFELIVAKLHDQCGALEAKQIGSGRLVTTGLS